MDGREKEVAQAIKQARSELTRVRDCVERARQLVLDYDPMTDGADRWDELRVAIDVDLREVERFFGGTG